ncbi:oxygen-dependent protoporphyrinogen oxidase [Paenibacillus shirakamiensis]|uniref:Coproporphyrinogen III oxidase n=1 Tax=Paenibacillus shirakamiensis TaxID=1265935 RepID=A0ABS4JI03_9BACL|nr:protoporphyrinogen oxidase [Paenibacillus shirakamiensis]MBP2001322.1 oxygen-dependent protoporphyrinogen oxidase [Paenibacillus shirakamiensis]
MNDSARKIVIVGGGLTGLSTAFYVRKFYREQGISAHITVLEKSRTMGGKIETLHRDGFVIEKGPDSFLARKTAMIELAQELEIEHELVSTNPNAKKTYIVKQGKLHPMPSGLVLGIPTEIGPFLKSGLISWRGKMRAMLDLVIPARKNKADESLGHFIERRLGSEVLQNVTEPLLAGIYAGNTYKLSLNSTFPQFGEVERAHGSVMRGMMSGKKPVETHSGTKRSAFLTFRQGLQSLIHALVHEMQDVQQMLDTEVTAIDQNEGRYTVRLGNGDVMEADQVVVTAPAFVAADLLRPFVNVDALDAVNYVSVANVVIAFKRKDLEGIFDASGFLVPRKEGRNITACTWTSTKWLHTSPEDHVLLRCYVGRSGDEQNVQLPDDALTQLVLKDLRELMGITATPLFTEITRLFKSMPQYPVGHLEHIASLRQQLQTQAPGLYVTGAAFEGVGLPDCIKQAKELAMDMADFTG